MDHFPSDVSTIHQSLEDRFRGSGIGIGRWKGIAYDNLYLKKGKLSVWLTIRYETEEAWPRQPRVYSRPMAGSA